jgi:hypothetical protein
LSGFKRLAEALEATETVRVLIGLSTDRSTFELLSRAREQMSLDLRSHAEAKASVPDETLSELEKTPRTAGTGRRRFEFVEWVKSGLAVCVFSVYGY